MLIRHIATAERLQNHAPPYIASFARLMSSEASLQTDPTDEKGYEYYDPVNKLISNLTLNMLSLFHALQLILATRIQLATFVQQDMHVVHLLNVFSGVII